MYRNVCGFLRVGALVITALALISCGKNSNVELPTPSASSVSSTSSYAPVVMVVAPEGQGLCTGTFISEKAVLTASHCLPRNGVYQVVSSFGTFTTSNKIRLGAGVVNDPNDIGLLMFDTAVASRAAGQVYDLGNSVRAGDELRLVGFGCNNLNTRRGAGVKRTGTNTVAEITEYVEFITPDTSGNSARGIFGPANRAASCFGDSGGPALYEADGEVKVVAVTHAGGSFEGEIFSQYANVADRADNRSFLADANTTYDLGIQGL